ncbi:hypothetical protein H5410_060924 [Solanum commersonii]|uniref:Retrotransposon gag domain-containing protein n=1 Tax=Solanum commersonii TaxID=4109 RepID=A0A9J5W808_SOLCO|nr:hypothetical protein H5410_060924 [Solanum commersonii]
MLGNKDELKNEVVYTYRIREFLRMNPLSFTGSSTTEDLKNFIEELKKVFKVMHVANSERAELVAYPLKNVSRTWFNQWKNGGVEDAPLASWACFEEAFLGRFFPRKLKEGKKQKGPDPSIASAPAPKNKGEYNSQNFGAKPAYSQGSMAQWDSKPPTCSKCECPKNKQGNGNWGNRAQSSSVAPLDRAAPRGPTFGTCGGKNCLYSINSRQGEEDLLDVVTGKIQVFDFTVYALLDP